MIASVLKRNVSKNVLEKENDGRDIKRKSENELNRKMVTQKQKMEPLL